jgi:hypothetical protein
MGGSSNVNCNGGAQCVITCTGPCNVDCRGAGACALTCAGVVARTVAATDP